MYTNKYLEWMFQKTIIISKFILFKILKLKELSRGNDNFIHFYLPVQAFHVFTFDIKWVRLNFFFPFFISVSMGKLGFTGYQFYIGLKADATSIDEYDGYDYMLSTAFRRIPLKKDCKVRSMASS